MYNGSWIDNAYKTIEITEGDDATNPDLIAWLSQNATYQEPTPPTPATGGSISFGNLSFAKVFLGTLEVNKMYYGNVSIYSAEPVAPQLNAPVISKEDDDLIIQEVENAEYYDIYVDGVLEESIDVRPITSFSNIHLKRISNEGAASYILNNGTEVNLAYNSEVVLNDVASLKIKIFGFGETVDRQLVKVDSSQYRSTSDTADIVNLDGFDAEENYENYQQILTFDLTEYLQNGCYISVRPDD